MCFYKLVCVLIVLVLTVSFSACNEKPQSPISGELAGSVSSNTDFDPNAFDSAVPDLNPNETFVNPFTGLKNLTADQLKMKPIGVTIANDPDAKAVQSGLNDADIVFEAEVEGGYTRLFAIYKAPKKSVSTIGPIRSARVVFAELSSILGGILVCHGMNETYCRPYINKHNIPQKEVAENSFADIIENGTEWNNLYTSGSLLHSAYSKTEFTNTENLTDPLFNFTDSYVSDHATPAVNITINYSAVQSTTFLYDSKLGGYLRCDDIQPLVDFVSLQEQVFRNIIVLETETKFYPDKECREIVLSGGEGYYFTGGLQEKITWSVSDENKTFTFQNQNNEPLRVATGNFYICIVNKNQQNRLIFK